MKYFFKVIISTKQPLNMLFEQHRQVEVFTDVTIIQFRTVLNK